ncbi:hypothetical protein B0O99DRAFT_742086 [Bisporella sp. PMI_857]|nr:hypothetical protein B0O99DRAFT_742086 [Bisporella sp. PMI_857]
MKLSNLSFHTSGAAILCYASIIAGQDTTQANGGFLCPTTVPAFNSWQVCQASIEYSKTFSECFFGVSTSSNYNWAACSCAQESQAVSCIDKWCPAHADVYMRPHSSYYCELATGGSPAYPSTPTIAAVTTGTVAATGSRAGTGVGAIQTGTANAQSTAKPGGAAMLEPALPIGAGAAALFGILAVML